MRLPRWASGWVWVLVFFALFFAFVRTARAQSASNGATAILRVCVKPPNVQKEVRVWAYTSGSAQVIPRNDFEKNYPGTTSYVFDPFAPPENTRYLPIPYNKLPCAPKPDPAPETPAPPKDPKAAPKGGGGSGGGGAGTGPGAAGGGAGGAGSNGATGTKKKDDPDEPPPGTPPKLTHPLPPDAAPPLPKGGVTEHWPETVLPVIVRTPILPSVDEGHGVLPMAGLDGKGTVLPYKHQVERELREAKEAATKAEAAKKAAQPKTFFEQCAEQAALAGGLANLQLGEDIHDKDGHKYGIPGGKNPDGIKSPVAQAVAGGVMIAAVVLTAGGADKKFFDALTKKTPLVVTGTGKAAEEAADKLIAQAITKSATHGAEDLAGALAHNGAIGEYSVMARFTKGLGGRWQAHHILEVSIAKDTLKIQATDKLPAVILSEAEHKAITKALAAEGTAKKSGQALWEAYKKVYAAHPDWLKAIQSYFGQ